MSEFFENILEIVGETGKHRGAKSGAAGGIGRGFLQAPLLLLGVQTQFLSRNQICWPGTPREKGSG